jgi:hypothetical protein
VNTSTIAKSIKTIHFNLLTLFFLLLIFLTGCFFALTEGFTISHLKFGDIKLEKVYLKWDNRLHIEIDLIDLSHYKSDESPLDLTFVQNFPRTIRYAQQWIQSIDLKEIRYQKTSLALHYTKGKKGAVVFQNPTHSLNGDFILTPTKLTLFLKTSKEDKINIASKLALNIPDQSFILHSTLKLPNSPLLKSVIVGNKKQLTFEIKADEQFTNISELVDFIGLDPVVRPWVVDYSGFQVATLHSFKGKYIYDAPQSLLESITAHATATKGHYTFAQDFEPVYATSVDVYFNHGKLIIAPHEGSFYTLPTQKSKVIIDFTPKETMLYIHLLTSQGMLNDAIIRLLANYAINIPIQQLQGNVNTDLNLSVNLHSLKTTAKGVFLPSASLLELEGIPLKSIGGKVLLNNTLVTFTDFNASYQNTGNAMVNGYFDATKEIGNIKISPHQLYPTQNPQQMALITRRPIELIYRITPKKDTLLIPTSDWNFFGKPLHINSFILPISIKDKHLTLPKTKFYSDTKISGFIGGNLTGKEKTVLLTLNRLDTNGLLMHKNPIDFHIKLHQDTLTASTTQSSSWSMRNQIFTLSPFSIVSNKNSLIFNNIKVNIENQLDAMLQGEYHWNNHQGAISLTQMSGHNPKISTYIDLKKRQEMTMDFSKEVPTFRSDSLGISITPFNLGWKMDIDDISLLSKNSPLLTDYELNHGNMVLFYTPQDNHITFNGTIQYPYRIMIVNEKPLSSYQFNGSHIDGKTKIIVNNKLTIQHDRAIDIEADSIGIHGGELLRWLSSSQRERKNNKSATTEDPQIIRVNTTNIHLYLTQNRQILSDTLQATLADNTLKATLIHSKGVANLTMKDDIFYLQGNHFGDKFMENLFAFSNFEGGNLSFTAQGKTDSFEGVVRIENTTLKEYIVLNNILSFVNTIPSLVTFSLPNYNTKGLFVKETYSHFTYQKQQFGLDNYTLNSPELKIGGTANVNMINDSITGTLTLKTDLGSLLSKIPAVGYILFGEDGSISTTVNLKGKLSDPIVETAVAKEVVSAPFNILKRTVTYPFLWMIPEEKKK